MATHSYKSLQAEKARLHTVLSGMALHNPQRGALLSDDSFPRPKMNSGNSAELLYK